MVAVTNNGYNYVDIAFGTSSSQSFQLLADTVFYYIIRHNDL